MKAYVTRVGSGAFPTELRAEPGPQIARRGDEFGATTGRPRRCGWFDAVAAAYACRINGIDWLAVTKPDVLDGLDELQICTGYKYKGSLLAGFPAESWILEKVVPVYTRVPGWKEPVCGAREPDDLPAGFRDYLRRIEDLTEAKAAIVSTGVEREATVFFEDRARGLFDVAAIRRAAVEA
jgi:adenylosuccinate synthase